MLLAITVIVASVGTPASLAATGHAFVGAYTGTGTGQVSGTKASGRATLSGRGNLIGPGTLSGSARGVFTSRLCVVFSGTAIIKGSGGSITLSARQSRACAQTTNPNNVSFSGTATITTATSTFAEAHGTLLFTGTYDRLNGAVSISLKGPIYY